MPGLGSRGNGRPGYGSNLMELAVPAIRGWAQVPPETGSREMAPKEGARPAKSPGAGTQADTLQVGGGPRLRSYDIQP